MIKRLILFLMADLCVLHASESLDVILVEKPTLDDPYFVHIGRTRFEAKPSAGEEMTEVSWEISSGDSSLQFHEATGTTTGDGAEEDLVYAFEMECLTAGKYEFTVKATIEEGHASLVGRSMSETVTVYVLDAKLVPDYDRDLKIDAEDKARADRTNPVSSVWYFWINDDHDDVDSPDAKSEFDAPGDPEPDYLNNKVLGNRDMTDYYPMLMDLQSSLSVLETHDVEYQWVLAIGHQEYGVFQQEKGSFFYTTLSETTSGQYLTEESVADLYNTATKRRIRNYLFGSQTRAGDPIDEAVLEKIHTDNTENIILIEHREAREYGEEDSCVVLKLVIEGDVVYSTQLDVAVGGVEDMYSHRDLRDAGVNFLLDMGMRQSSIYSDVDFEGGRAVAENKNLDLVAADFPSEEEGMYYFFDDGYVDASQVLVFVHGYNNNTHARRGGAAEVFKRMFWSGSTSRFYSVGWYGYHSKWEASWWHIFDWATWLGEKCPNYQGNVVNSFITAEPFKEFMHSPEFNGVTAKNVVAHSLGNMVVSSAIQDHGLSIDHYFMINAAIAAEAHYDEEELPYDKIEKDMVHKQWGKLFEPAVYANLKHVFAWNWYLLFDGMDPENSRNKLTWTGRFRDVKRRCTKLYNIMSDGDETFYPHPHDQSTYGVDNLDTALGGIKAFCLQEKKKGRGGLAFEQEFGWGFNEHYLAEEDEDEDLDEQDRYSIAGLLLLDPSTFIQSPLFAVLDATYYKKDDVHSIDPATFFTDRIELGDGEEIEYDNVRYHTMLAKYIPAKTFGLGGTPSLGFPIDIITELEMEDRFNSGWFYEVAGNNNYWNHGDFKTVPFVFTRKLYQYITSQIESD